jgi:DNA invertase Pin-like site-specific DNA recombinase
MSSGKCIFVYVRRPASQTAPDADLADEVRRAIQLPVHSRIETFADDASATGRGKRTHWNRLVSRWSEADCVIIASAADLPCRTVSDLLKLLALFRDHDVDLRLHAERIDTAASGYAVVDVVDSFRRVRRGAAIKAGQERAKAAGKKVGRPPLPACVTAGIRVALANGHGIRATARRYGVSAGSIINIRAMEGSHL